ncbi:hypothetical protein EPT53_04335 [Fusobacterium necrophorum]|uniref:Uncharacterized protein n=1 Tax=Fusobacterium necrophorum TaxID=859 RepID=A0A4Q2L1E3_9FUSO|nr:AAA family ATPase [Fusobacterium necrophorum]RXZ70183.1 hypothetical protein EPT53_04335 [Fusobacterium necrophorum]
MRLEKIFIQNYKKFQEETIKFNQDINIFVGDNNSGKSTILEAISMVITGKVGGLPIINKLNLDWFNSQVRKQFKASLIKQESIEPPEIIIEAYFDISSFSEAEVKLNSYKGSNNFLRENAAGVRVHIKLNPEYSENYKELLKNGKIEDIPIELYKIEFRNFAGSFEYYSTGLAKKIAIIDTTKKDYGSVLNRFISNSISNFLSEDEKANLRVAYRTNRKDFTNSDSFKKLNEKISLDYSFADKKVNINLRENEIDSWKNEMSISLDDIPIENVGFGIQNLLKSHMFLRENTEVDILCVEEPENKLSFTNMSIFIYKLSKLEKQLFISTHSSFVANKLNLKNIHLVSNNNIKKFSDVPKDTYEYFLKLSGYDTLRLILAKTIILVEGPTDELIIQRAYKDKYGVLPIYDGVDVMSLGGVAFKNYCDLAMMSQKEIFITTDNDGNYLRKKEKFKPYSDYVRVFIEENEEKRTLEPSVLSVNSDNFWELKKIIYHGQDADSKTETDILNFMLNNKTDWALRVFQAEHPIKYPNHINELLEALKHEK